MTNILIKYRHWFLVVTLVLSAVCAVLIPHVNINTDMSKYLPDDSKMRAGLEIMSDEFGDLAENNGGGIRVMFDQLSEEQKTEIKTKLREIKDVNSVITQENGSRTLFELGVSNSVDQMAIGEEISEQFSNAEAIETSQDGAVPGGYMLIGAVLLLMIILFSMCRSWLEPVLFLSSTGIAVLLNVGTNALLPSVSVTTNSIVAILQLVLSMDYSIILLNHFRQDKALTDDSVEAMRKAMSRAASPIISSALTTIVGLIMLVFMKLKIGADLGVVLSKGVLCSLICNFTVLPALILLFEKGIYKSAKKVLPIPTDKLAKFSMRFHIPLTILFIVIFVGSYILHNQTNIIFYNATESQIEQYFPKKNPVVLVYDNADEKKMLPLLDSISKDSGVEMVISYPTLLHRECTAPQMVETITDLSAMMGSMVPEADPTMNMDMLTDEIFKIVYFAAHNGHQELTMDFNEMADFIIAQANDPNSLLGKQLDDETRAQIGMLDEIRNPFSSTEEEIKEIAPVPAKTVTHNSTTPTVTHTASAPTPTKTHNTASNTPIQSTQVSKTPTQSSSTPQSSSYTNVTLLNTPMTSEEMASYLTMDAGQAKMVYKLAKRGGSTMAPIQFVHFLTDDIMQRKGLGSMIKGEQKSQLLALKETMDAAILAAQSKPTDVQPTTPDPEEKIVENTDDSLAIVSQDSVQQPIIIPVQPEVAQQQPKIPVIRVKQNPNDPIVVLDEMLSGKKEYTAKQMVHNMSLLGEEIPEALINLLYIYHASGTDYDSTWTMTLEELVTFLADSVLADPSLASIMDSSMRKGLTEVKKNLLEGVGQLRGKEHSIAMIITDLRTESPETYSFIDHLHGVCQKSLSQPYYAIGESVMLSEMKAGFNKELLLVTLLTIAAIFLIVALTFRSLLLAAILVCTVMSGVFVNVVVNGVGGGSILYIAYLIVQSILMGAAIDYGILFANYYKKKRVNMSIIEALTDTYRCATHTILTSGSILILVPAIMTFLVDEPTISAILQSISVGSFVTVLLILFVLPGVLATCDRIVIHKPKSEKK
ncbi:MAG: MMPL family transporter [Bacteroidales bacterium]|nr:MMPL family transporter [Bacteroidales bacterium]